MWSEFKLLAQPLQHSQRLETALSCVPHQIQALLREALECSPPETPRQTAQATSSQAQDHSRSAASRWKVLRMALRSQQAIRSRRSPAAARGRSKYPPEGILFA